MVQLFGKKGKLNKIRKGVSKDLGHLATKGHAALKDYAEKAPERRAARIQKLNQQAEMAEAEARLRKARTANRPQGGSFGMGMGGGMGAPSIGSPSMGLGVPSIGQPAAKPKAKKKTQRRRPRVIVY